MITNPVVSGSFDGEQAAPAKASNDLGKDAFLKLLTAQLANQDPLQPVDNQAFVAQLAQFSSLEQMQGVSARLDSLLLATSTSTQLDAASLVGKRVTYNASAVDVTSGQTAPQFSASTTLRSNVTVVIQDSAGLTVRTLATGIHDGGTFEIPWDGLDADGRPVASGTYSISASARALDGSSASVTLRAAGTVDQIEFGTGGARLVIGSTRVKLSDVAALSSERKPS